MSAALPAPIPHPGEQIIFTEELVVQRGQDVDAHEQGHQVSRQPVDQPQRGPEAAKIGAASIGKLSISTGCVLESA